MKKMMLAVGMSLFAVAAFAGGTPARARVNGVAHVALDLKSGMPVLEVRINDAGPYRFGLDTNAKSALIVDADLARTLALAHRGTEDILNTTTKAMEPHEIVGVGSVKLGDAQFDTVDAIVADVQSKIGLDGLVGFGMFNQVLATIDYPKSELRIALGALPRRGSAIMRTLDGVPAIVIQAGDRYMFASVNTELPASLTMPAIKGSLPALGNEFLAKSAVTFDAAHGRAVIE